MGIDLIDRQHKELFSLLAQLFKVVESGNTTDMQKQALHSYLFAVERHFQSEEDLLQQAGYPGYEKQCADHSKLLKPLRDLVAKVSKKPIGLTVEILMALQTPMFEHILGPDAAYAEFLRDQGIK